MTAIRMRADESGIIALPTCMIACPKPCDALMGLKSCSDAGPSIWSMIPRRATTIRCPYQLSMTSMPRSMTALERSGLCDVPLLGASMRRRGVGASVLSPNSSAMVVWFSRLT